MPCRLAFGLNRRQETPCITPGLHCPGSSLILLLLLLLCRFDYLPVSVVGGGMHHYVGHTALLPCSYVSPLHMKSLDGLVGGPWLVLSGGAELMGRDIDR
jgi:hypothetical protein